MGDRKDGKRFDALAKTVASAADRRRLLGGLLGAALGSRVAPGNVATAAAVCDKDEFERCTAPLVKKLAAAGMRCRDECEGKARRSAACRACLKPTIDATTPKVEACAAKTCRDGSALERGAARAASGATAPGGAVAQEAAACAGAELSKCRKRNLRNYYNCLFFGLAGCDDRRSCSLGPIACVTDYLIGKSDCWEDHGCKGKDDVCVRNPGPSGPASICCPSPDGNYPEPCNGTCCPKGQECCDGTCVAEDTCCQAGEKRCGTTCCRSETH